MGYATISQQTWNQKNLDYEIETLNINIDKMVVNRLEIKRTSITRLKPAWRYMPRLWGTFTWNQKNLDYEIETFLDRQRP